MKFLVKENFALAREGRWDIDYHLPAEGILRYPQERLIPVSTLADVPNKTRDPGQKLEEAFIYVDIASVDVLTGTINNPQELTGEEAPSRARMVIRAFDVIVSTVRPTRGAVAVVPPELDNQICSTGFCVLRCKEGVNPYYLHFVLRLDSTLEQFRKFSTGSSYPAILDSDVSKTLIPSATRDEQDAIAKTIMAAYAKYVELLQVAKTESNAAKASALQLLEQKVGVEITVSEAAGLITRVTIEEIEAIKERLFEAAPQTDTDKPAEVAPLIEFIEVIN
jgi:restriction endonuclease S subunit